MTDEPELRIRPEPAPRERRMIEAALAAARAEAEAPVRSAWWAAGIRENTSDPWLERPGEF